jgi:SHAQKYF class myb-like DNA-binding protein
MPQLGGGSQPAVEPWAQSSAAAPSYSAGSPGASSGGGGTGSGSAAKQRLRWTPELHERFVDAVTQLGGPDRECFLSLAKCRTLSLSLSLSLSRQIQPSYVCLVKGVFFHQCYALFFELKCLSVCLSVYPDWQEQPQKVCCG